MLKCITLIGCPANQDSWDYAYEHLPSERIVTVEHDAPYVHVFVDVYVPEEIADEDSVSFL